MLSKQESAQLVISALMAIINNKQGAAETFQKYVAAEYI